MVRPWLVGSNISPGRGVREAEHGEPANQRGARSGALGVHTHCMTSALESEVRRDVAELEQQSRAFLEDTVPPRVGSVQHSIFSEPSLRCRSPTSLGKMCAT